MADHGSMRVILAALGGNLALALAIALAIALVKVGAEVYPLSSALLAEAIHSSAVTGNQLLLLVGISLAKRRADERRSVRPGKERSEETLIVSDVRLWIDRFEVRLREQNPEPA